MLIPTTRREDMSLAEMIRHASEYGVPLEKYDPHRLVRDVKELLATHGLHPETPPETGRTATAVSAAGALLLALGIAPLGGVEAIDRINTADPHSR